jgi:uncharacterized protein YqjF (DUF2071 family)
MSTTLAPITRDPPGHVHRPVMLMRWKALTALHWPVEPSVVQRHLPPGLRADVFDGAAWVGLIPFQMRDVRLPGMPTGIPWVGTFPETNVRTYVVGPDGRRGVWFASLDITRAAAVAVARLGYRLPYHYGAMSIQRQGRRFTYRGRRRWQTGATSLVSVEVASPALTPGDETDLDRFLSARWCLFADGPAGLLRADVDHGVWPLHRARVLALRDGYTAAAGYDLDEPPAHVAFSPGVDVRVGLPVRA